MTDLKIVTNADTGTADIVGGNDWDDMAVKVNNLVNVPDFAKYFIYNSGSTYYAKNGATKAIDYSGTDAGAVINSALTASTSGGLFLFAPHVFNLGTKISIPIGATSGSRKPYFFRGIHSAQRQTGTTFQPNTAFTDQNFMIDASVIAASGKTPLLEVRDCYFYNPYPWTGGAATSTDKRVGGILYGSDAVATTSDLRTLYLENIEFQYCWRGIDLQGATYGPYLNNIVFSSASTGVKGEYDLKLEQAGLVDRPKSAHIGSIYTTHTAVYDNSVSIEGTYNYVNNFMIDGTLYLEAALVFRGGTNPSNSNVVNRISLLDLNGVPGAGSYATGPGNVADARKAGILFDGANCYDNHINNGETGVAPYMVALKNGAFRNTAELGYFGSAVNIDDTGAGIENVIFLQQGQQPSATANTKITSTSSLVKIVDQRKGAENKGVSTQSGNASTTAFNIAHGLYTTPASYTLVPQSADATGAPVVTATSTNLVLTYPVAPPTGSSNLIWVWSAGVY